MKLTAERLNRATLGRQMLLEREGASLEETLRRIVALQAQMPPSPYLALWNRIDGFDPTDLDEAFLNYRVVKGHQLRMTLHATLVDDYRPFREAVETSQRTILRDKRFTKSGAIASDVDALMPHLLDYTREPRTAAELQRWVEEQIASEAASTIWMAVRRYAPLLRAPTGGPWAFDSQITYITPPVPTTLADEDVSATALETLIWRYLEGFGPASVADMGQFMLIQRGKIRAAIKAIGDRLVQYEGPNGEELFDVPGGLLPDGDTPAPPRLMAMWDSTLLAYSDRSRIIPDPYRKVAIRSNGDVLPTLLVDGQVAGLWRALEHGVEASAFQPLPEPVWDQLEAEAHQLCRFLASRDAEVYRRYHHWWDKIPDLEPRLLAGSRD